ncbi:MAG: hypothetical protein ABWX73_07725 [Marmoricola sp.]
MNSTPISRSKPLATSVAVCLAGLLALLLALGSMTAASASPSPAQRTSVTARTAAPGCTAFKGARTLGYYYSDAYVRIDTCGLRPSFDGARNGGGPVIRPYAGSSTYYLGYQCIELVARYLKARYDANPGKANGAQAVDRYASVYPTKFVKIANGTRNKAPRKGDVMSLSANRSFNDVGHTGIVISSSVNSSGNGTVRAIEQNWGGTGGTSGYHNYTVRKWSVSFSGLPHIKWLRAR